MLEPLGSDLQTLSDSLKRRAVELEAGAGTAERGKRIAQVAELEDRQWLGTVVGDVKNEIDRLRRVRALDACLAEAKTNAITAKSKALAKEHVTDYLRRAFASEVKTMQQGVNRIEVELAETSGEYGTSNYRIQLVGATRTPIDRVLSEGEHRCIALAGFLAELATQTPKSGVVFDDPVTSLDHRWRHCLADRLVKEAEQRQVIVFTHDIVFLHDIMDGGRKAGINVTTQRVESTRERAGLVSNSLPWVAQSCEQQIDTLQKLARASRTAYECADDDGYFDQARGVYSRLRSTVESVIEGVVFAGVVYRFRDYVNLARLAETVIFDAADCKRIQNLFATCCDMTDAHSPSPGRSLAVPTPDKILADIQDLGDFIRQIRARQNAAKKAVGGLP